MEERNWFSSEVSKVLQPQMRGQQSNREVSWESDIFLVPEPPTWTSWVLAWPIAWFKTNLQNTGFSVLPTEQRPVWEVHMTITCNKNTIFRKKNRPYQRGIILNTWYYFLCSYKYRINSMNVVKKNKNNFIN